MSLSLSLSLSVFLPLLYTKSQILKFNVACQSSPKHESNNKNISVIFLKTTYRSKARNEISPEEKANYYGAVELNPSLKN